MTTKAKKKAAVIATYKSKSRPKAKPYEVRISRQDAKIYCNCKGWQMRKNCTHLQQFFSDLDDPVITDRIRIDTSSHQVRCNCTDALCGNDMCEHVIEFVDSLPEAE